MKNYFINIRSLALICLGLLLIASVASNTYFGYASSDNRTSIESAGLKNMTSTNDTNIVLVHGAGSDGSSWSKVIPILTDAGHRVIAAQLPLYSLKDDVDTVKRAVERAGGPTVLVGHSYGGEVITNAGYNNPNVTGLVILLPLLLMRARLGMISSNRFPRSFRKGSMKALLWIAQDFCTLTPKDYVNFLLRMLIRLRLISWL